MTVSFFAHKGGTHQTNISPAPINPGPTHLDPVVTFPVVKWNVGAPLPYDPTTSRLTLPGLWWVEASYNVFQPVDGGKYYALLRKNGEYNIVGNNKAFEMLRPIRPRVTTTDTAGTAVGGLVNMKDGDYLEAVFQHSNNSSLVNIDGSPFASYFCGIRLGDPVEEAGEEEPPENVEQTTGSLEGPVVAGTFTYVDRGFTLNTGATVEKLGMYTQTAGSYTLKIVKRNSPGNYDVVVSEAITHTGTGWEEVAITPFVVPSGEYHVGAVTAGVSHMMFDGNPRAFAASNITGTVTMTEQDISNDSYVIGVRAVYQ